MKIKRRSLTLEIPQKSLRVFEFYAKHYEIPISHLLQSESYGQILILTDNVFGSLQRFDSSADSTPEIGVKMEFCPDCYALPKRVSELLRRPMPELLRSCLLESADVLADYIQDALGGKGMDGPHMSYAADTAISFERLARQNKTPAGAGCVDSWQWLNVSRKRSSKTKSPATPN